MEEYRKAATVHAILIIIMLKVNMLWSTSVTTVHRLWYADMHNERSRPLLQNGISDNSSAPCPYEDTFIMIADPIATMEECRKPADVRAILIIKLLKVNMRCGQRQ